MILTDKLREEKRKSSGTTPNEEINYRVRLSEVEYHNELIAQRIDQLAASIEKNNKNVNESISETIKMNKQNNDYLQEMI